MRVRDRLICSGDLCSCLRLEKAAGSRSLRHILLPALRGRPPEVCIAFLEVCIDCGFGIVGGFVITVVDDCTGHAAEYGLDYIEELST